jgi:hypothetical protein
VADDAERHSAAQAARAAWIPSEGYIRFAASCAAATFPGYAAFYAATPSAQSTQCAILRDIFGNPFLPLTPISRGVLAWNDATVRRIAEGIYEERAFDRLPILADALLDAGCDNDDLIQHCRSAGPHVRGCWAVDRILGKE